jgi:hypothetical protein
MMLNLCFQGKSTAPINLKAGEVYSLSSYTNEELHKLRTEFVRIRDSLEGYGYFGEFVCGAVLLDPRLALDIPLNFRGSSLGEIFGLYKDLQREFKLHGKMICRSCGAFMNVPLTKDEFKDLIKKPQILLFGRVHNTLNGGEKDLVSRYIVNGEINANGGPEDYAVVESLSADLNSLDDLWLRISRHALLRNGVRFSVFAVDSSRTRCRKIGDFSFIEHCPSCGAAASDWIWKGIKFEALAGYSLNQILGKFAPNEAAQTLVTLELGDCRLGTKISDLSYQQRLSLMLASLTLSKFQGVLFFSDQFCDQALLSKFVSLNKDNYFVAIDRESGSSSLEKIPAQRTVAQLLGILDPLRGLYAATATARRLGFKAKDFQDIDKCGLICVEGVSFKECLNSDIARICKVFHAFSEVYEPACDVLQSGFGYLRLSEQYDALTVAERKVLGRLNNHETNISSDLR